MFLLFYNNSVNLALSFWTYLEYIFVGHTSQDSLVYGLWYNLHRACVFNYCRRLQSNVKPNFAYSAIFFIEVSRHLALTLQWQNVYIHIWFGHNWIPLYIGLIQTGKWQSTHISIAGRDNKVQMTWDAILHSNQACGLLLWWNILCCGCLVWRGP